VTPEGERLSLPYTPDLSEAGAVQVTRQWMRLGWRSRPPDFNALRQLAAQAATEIAFIRYLSNQDIAHEVIASSASRWPASALRLGGRPVYIHGHLARQRMGQATLNGDLLAGTQAAEGAHLFARAYGMVSKGPKDLPSDKPHFLLHPLPALWALPHTWRPLGALAIKLEEGLPLDLELGGLTSERRALHLDLKVPAGERVSLETDLYALHYLRAGQAPIGRLGVSSPSTGLTHIIQPREWGNLFVYGERIDILGYLSARELLGRRRRRALDELRPVADLLARAREWAGESKIS
jgi:hypothetical protein